MNNQIIFISPELLNINRNLFELNNMAEKLNSIISGYILFSIIFAAGLLLFLVIYYINPSHIFSTELTTVELDKGQDKEIMPEPTKKPKPKRRYRCLCCSRVRCPCSQQVQTGFNCVRGESKTTITCCICKEKGRKLYNPITDVAEKNHIRCDLCLCVRCQTC